MGLLQVPGTAFGASQAVHDFYQFVEVNHGGFLGKMLNTTW